MHGQGGEEGKRQRHMLPALAPDTAVSVSTPAASSPPVGLPENPLSESSSTGSSCDSFLKDGHKIRVGDCALFQAGNAPPFIGIIRWFKDSKENYLNLCVNWLYQPADIKLAKGAVEASLNEVFYLFHKDVITTASLLHPCKVAFLCKGVELPAEVPSFVCRRVYDITNKCLWWLTDQDYINERQEEVDQLLDKTQLEMHTTVQSDGRSPKPLNGPASTQQVKFSSESAHNTGSSLPSQSKGKRKDRSDQSTEPVERECSSKPDDGDPISFISDSTLKAEIAKITVKGGLISSEGVEKLVNLMHLYRTEKKIDVAGRILAADVISATDRYDCLSKFVQHRGLLILDEWLQEVHKSKNSDGSSPRDGDKNIEELLLALLRALSKLPVNLHALQTCNIGKSVNNLRSHKNLEIQKKSRSLIDTWKKRVDAEISKNCDVKSVASGQPVWQAKPGSSDVPQTANRRTGSNEVATKNPVTQTAPAKAQPGKLGHTDGIVKLVSVSQGSLKAGSTQATSIAVGLKDPLCKAASNVGSADTSTAAVKEEKSSSSSQSQNDSQTCSGDNAKTVGASWKEDTRSSTAGSTPSKAAGSSSRHRRSGNGVSVTSTSGVPKETYLGKSSSVNKATTMEKSSQLGHTCEKPIDMLVSQHGNNHRLIVKLPNTMRSPARSISGGCSEDASVLGSRASSPVSSDKNEHGERRVKVRSDVSHSNNAMDSCIELCQSNDIKLPIGAGGMTSPTADEPHGRTSEETGKTSHASREVCSSTANEVVLSPEPRASSLMINALIDSCRNSLDDSTPIVEDENGMNLLASVAAGEIFNSKLISPTGSPAASPAIEGPTVEGKFRLGSDNDAAQSQKSRLSDDDAAQSHVKSDESVDIQFKKQEKSIVFSYHDKPNFPANDMDMAVQDTKSSGKEAVRALASVSSHVPEVSHNKSETKLDEEKDGIFCGSTPAEVEKQDRASTLDKKIMTVEMPHDHLTVKEESLSADESKPDACAHQTIEKYTCSSEVAPRDGDEHKIPASCNESEKLVVEKSHFCVISKDRPGVATSSDQQQHLLSEERKCMTVIASSAPGVSSPGNNDETGTRMPDDTNSSNLELKNSQEPNLELSNLDESGRKPTSSFDTAGVVEDSKMTEVHENSPVGSKCTSQEIQNQPKPDGSRLSEVVEGGRDDLASSAGTSSVSVTAESNSASKLTFDLNEGISGDEWNHGEDAVSVSATVCSAIELPRLSSFANPISNGSPASITVAAPAKGSFVPPEILPKSKGEGGWKGSAATSAFRPAEPRKLLEMPLNVPVPSDAAGKQCRVPLDIDLNEPDDRVLEDMAIHSSSKPRIIESGNASHLDITPRISGGLDLDLNIVNEDTENGQYLASTSNRLEVPLLAGGTAAASEFPNKEANMLRDFDLNNGPGLDEVSAEPVSRSHNMKNTSSVPFIFPVASVRMNTAEMGSVSSWFPPGTSYPAVAIPPFMSNREQSYPIVAAPGGQRILGPVTSSSSFGGSGDVYRSPVLSLSPPMAFTPATFPYAGLPYASNFPVPAASLSGGSTNYVDSPVAGSGFPAIPSLLVGPAGTVLSNYRRPHVVSLPESSTSGGSDNTRKWMTPSLDLNAGPVIGDVEGKDEGLPFASRQFLAANSRPFSEEQMRIYALQGGAGLKRKEPDGDWDADRSSYKQLSWQ